MRATQYGASVTRTASVAARYVVVGLVPCCVTMEYTQRCRLRHTIRFSPTFYANQYATINHSYGCHFRHSIYRRCWRGNANMLVKVIPLNAHNARKRRRRIRSPIQPAQKATECRFAASRPAGLNQLTPTMEGSAGWCQAVVNPVSPPGWPALPQSVRRGWVAGMAWHGGNSPSTESEEVTATVPPTGPKARRGCSGPCSQNRITGGGMVRAGAGCHSGSPGFRHQRVARQNVHRSALHQGGHLR